MAFFFSVHHVCPLVTCDSISCEGRRVQRRKSLQKRMKSLNLSLKEITTKVCMSERLCSTLRKKVHDIETQLPALLEAKMLALSETISVQLRSSRRR